MCAARLVAWLDVVTGSGRRRVFRVRADIGSGRGGASSIRPTMTRLPCVLSASYDSASGGVCRGGASSLFNTKGTKKAKV